MTLKRKDLMMDLGLSSSRQKSNNLPVGMMWAFHQLALVLLLVSSIESHHHEHHFQIDEIEKDEKEHDKENKWAKFFDLVMMDDIKIMR